MDIVKVLADQSSEWRFVDPGGSGWLFAFYIHPVSGDLFVSSDMEYSMFRSRDRAETWEPISNVVPGTTFGIVGDPQNHDIIYINQISEDSGNSGIWKSQDCGDTWELICSSDTFGPSQGQSGLVDPDDSKTLFWATSKDGVWCSNDGGKSWNPMNEGLPVSSIKQSRHLNAIEMEYYNKTPNRVIYYPTNVGLFKCSMKDRSWEEIKAGDCNQVAVCDGGVLYAAFPEEGLFKSCDEGKRWEKLDSGLDGKNPWRVVACRENPDILYVATVRDQGVYKSSDGGKSFTLVTHSKHNVKNNWPLNYRQTEAVSAFYMAIDPEDPQTVYLDYNKKTHDGGKTWLHYGTKEVSKDRWTTTGLAVLTEYVAEFDPNIPGRVWLGFSDTGLSLSEDNGASIISAPSYHRGEVNQVAGYRDRLVHTSGSCPAVAVDPERSNTILATISNKDGLNRTQIGGMLLKSVDGGWNWDAVYHKHGLPDGIVRAIAIDPKSPVQNRVVYVASFGNGVYKSEDGANTFFEVMGKETLGANTRVMDLVIAKNNTNILYAAVGGSIGIRPLLRGPEGYPPMKSGAYGGVFKSSDAGKTWEKLNAKTELPSVQKLCVHPFDDNVVYAALYDDSYFDKADREHVRGGVYRSDNGGQDWSCIFAPPVDPIYGKGYVCSMVLNPVAPEIMYVAVERHGVYGTIDGGSHWYQLGKKSMDKMQRRYHSINVNPHNVAEVWVAHFGSSFSKITDTVAQAYLASKFKDANLVYNGDFEEMDSVTGFLRYWQYQEPPRVQGEEPVVTISSDGLTGQCVRFNQTQAYAEADSLYPAEQEQRRLQELGEIPVDHAWMNHIENVGETRSYLKQKIQPYFVSLARGRKVKIEMDVFITCRHPRDWWMLWSETCEAERFPPQLYLAEIRDYNVNWVIAETYIDDEYKQPEQYMGKWIKLSSEGYVSNEALGLNIVITGVDAYSNSMDIKVDNVSLKIMD